MATDRTNEDKTTTVDTDPAVTNEQATDNVQLERSTYDIIRNRLSGHATELRTRLDKLNVVRRDVFGAIESKLLASDRISTQHNCVARDMVAIGDRFVFGYNVHLGLKSEMDLADVFAVHSFRENAFHAESLDLIEDPRFREDFAQLFRYFKNTRFANFFVKGPNLYMVFQTGKAAEDIKVFKWAIAGEELKYIDARSEHEVKYPAQHEFRWTRTHMDQHREGAHPHVSIDNRIFVETVGGDLTIKVEDNTSSGHGIYAEDVNDPDQGLGDADIFYAIVGDIILLKIRPYQEDDYRYIIYSEKVREARRVDAIADACVLLPEDHGVIFSNGYYLQTGEHKTFESGMRDLSFYRRVMAPNGEDYLYVFYNRETGTYVLLSYNVIERRVMTPIVCHGYSLFENGRLVFFKSGSEAQKHHALQVWQTPYVGENHTQTAQTDSYLYKIGNPEIVRGMAECHEIVALTAKDDSFANLYIDLVKKTGNVLDAYFWMKPVDADASSDDEAPGAATKASEADIASSLGVVVAEIRDTAKAAVDEFDKVQRVREMTAEQTRSVAARAEAAKSKVRSHRFETIDAFVESLAELRHVRGEIVGLRELRFVDESRVDELDASVAETSEELSLRCVDFLLQDDALTPYEQRVSDFAAQSETVTKVADARELSESVDAGAQELDMLIDIVSNLKIDDATQRTEIIENISTIYARLNQVRAGLKKQTQQLLSVEGEAEFHSQIKLLEQSVINYLDVCDTPEKCDEYLTKLMVQVEELEGRFAEFEGFLTQLTDRRQEIYATFDGKKVALVEARNRRATSLATVADRILKGIETRVGQLDDINDIHSYFAADVMVDKVRNLVDQLTELEDSVKVDEIQSRLKTVREDAIRQLKDRQELYVDGENIIQLGRHKFSVNTQPLDLTTVMKDDQLYFHLTGTNYMESVTDEQLLATRADEAGETGAVAGVWSMTSPAENADVARAEFLAYQVLNASLAQGTVAQLLAGAGEGSQADGKAGDALLADVQQFMATRHQESYTKGIHDHDATLILRVLLGMHSELGAARYPADARALAISGLHEIQVSRPELYRQLMTQLRSLGALRSAFGGSSADSARLQNELRTALGNTGFANGVFSRELLDGATDFVIDQLTASVDGTSSNLSLSRGTSEFGERSSLSEGEGLARQPLSIGQAAAELQTQFTNHLNQEHKWETLNQLRQDIAASDSSVVAEYLLLQDWLSAFVASREKAADAAANIGRDVIVEAAATLLANADVEHARNPSVLQGNPHSEISGLVGDHARLQGDTYQLHYHEFTARLSRFETHVVPQYTTYVARKREIVDARRESLRLDEFRPRVLTSFVRNRLIDEVYLPMVGDNLAKQIGVVGEQKRTDLMGMLLLISPPGYGKTTLMEYVANRLGLTFMKINGPAIGHQVTSLDPAEAPNASAREEIEKLNLALEMGDNVMLYIDDIQHCNPEFLQKFISLCDAQRKIEGVFQGRTRRYDLRGRKVAVVMAGNPYTESGHKFQIPDMLTSRADTYNLGDVTGNYQDAFEMSYLENAVTSNPALSTLASRSHDDVCNVIRMATLATGTADDRNALAGVDLDGNYTAEQLTEFTNVIRKLVRIRETVLRVNSEYIRSAAQSDDYRTEPAFKLQGSYRDMNKMAEAVAAIMNEEELDALIRSHYENQAQTLTGDAEANLLKLRELRGDLAEEHVARWEEIRSGFQRNLLLGAAGDDKFAQIVGQMMDFRTGLDEIRTVLAQGMEQNQAHRQQQAQDVSSSSLSSLTAGENELGDFHGLHEQLVSLNHGLAGIRSSMIESATRLAEAESAPQKVEYVYRVPKAFLDVIRGQFTVMQGWLEPIIRLTEQSNEESQALRASMQQAVANYRQLIANVEQSEMVEE